MATAAPELVEEGIRWASLEAGEVKTVVEGRRR